MRYIFLQNTITPYRVSLFNELYKTGLDFEVLYMCKMEADRSWKIDQVNMRFPYTIERGLYKMWRGFHLHWNISIIKKIIKTKDEVILGGAWNDLNVMAICLLKRFNIVKANLIFWAESNYLTIGASKSNKFRDKLRHFIYLSGSHSFIVPGRMAEISLEKWNVPIDKKYILPNVIEEDKFEKFKREVKTEESLPVFTCPARLIERLKGINNFFKALGKDNIKRAKFYILGNGPDQSMLEKYIEFNQLQNNIELLGFCSMERVINIYSITDVFFLPSFSDQSPLSIVEALCCGLPLLVSERCGNHFEAVQDGINGYCFDPFNPEEIRNCFERLMSRRSDWMNMGVKSQMIFEENFKQSEILPKLVNQLNNI